eukprot:CAMPEP_0119126352 /NCGR_PEP_ID=MMETSP1310-20130426/5313_1 /TAXON_ID=464262 /ORGANISM="Genus nov. species nov., Strain RCC2339" /LENGTH=51 /DNA_ID=CAMNT_0007116507 /DNA_START=51 /DNA_END=203 /DNA_ORIENTATION=+
MEEEDFVALYDIAPLYQNDLGISAGDVLLPVTDDPAYVFDGTCPWLYLESK